MCVSFASTQEKGNRKAFFPLWILDPEAKSAGMICGCRSGKGIVFYFLSISNLHLKQSHGFLCENKIHSLKLDLGLNGETWNMEHGNFPVVLFSDCSYCKL